MVESGLIAQQLIEVGGIGSSSHGGGGGKDPAVLLGVLIVRVLRGQELSKTEDETKRIKYLLLNTRPDGRGMNREIPFFLLFLNFRDFYELQKFPEVPQNL